MTALQGLNPELEPNQKIPFERGSKEPLSHSASRTLRSSKERLFHSQKASFSYCTEKVVLAAAVELAPLTVDFFLLLVVATWA